MNIGMRIAGILLTVIMGYSTMYSTVQKKQTGKVYVLCYHTWLGKARIGSDFSAKAFAKHIETMKNLGYRFVSFQDVLDGKVSGNTNILITIDDGNKSVKNVYKSVLKKYDIKPIMFIYPCVINHARYGLKYKELKAYYNDDCMIGSHGYYHQRMNKKFYKKDKREFVKEIVRSKQKLEKKLKISIDTFGYPYGIYFQGTINELKKAGYKYAFRLGEKTMKLPLSLQNPYELPRFYMTKPNWHILRRELIRNMKEVKSKALVLNHKK